MDIVFDIDGTLADATHRLHFIKDMKYWTPNKPGGPVTPDWDSFLADAHVAGDAPIKPVWRMLDLITMAFTRNMLGHDRILFITGRNENTREMTRSWIDTWAKSLCMRPEVVAAAPIYMRPVDDHSPSRISKRGSLMRARADGYEPMLAYEDRNSDTEMWREEGLICCQVADGNF